MQGLCLSPGKDAAGSSPQDTNAQGSWGQNQEGTFAARDGQNFTYSCIFYWMKPYCWSGDVMLLLAFPLWVLFHPPGDTIPIAYNDDLVRHSTILLPDPKPRSQDSSWVWGGTVIAPPKSVQSLTQELPLLRRPHWGESFHLGAVLPDLPTEETGSNSAG